MKELLGSQTLEGLKLLSDFLAYPRKEGVRLELAKKLLYSSSTMVLITSL